MRISYPRALADLRQNAAALRRARELEQAIPVSAIARRNEEWNRRAAEMEPIDGF